MAARGAYGQNLANFFHLGTAPSFISRTLSHSQIAVTQIVCNEENHGLTAIPREDAFLVTLQLMDCPAHDLWIDGKAVKTGPLAAGTTCVYDLRRNPTVNSISPFRNLHFYFPRNALDAAADGGDTSSLDSIPHNPGLGMDDAVIRGLGMSLLSAFERPGDEVSGLFVEHITTAAAAYVARLFGAAPETSVTGGLARWQEERTKEMLSSRLDGVVSIAQLARECGLSARAFSSAFQQSTGMLPHRWLLEQRIEKAKNLLNANLPLSEVAAACGFAGAEHLKRVFKQRNRVLPERQPRA
jgi:AraC family transcriptional regulator